jgi:hypothetical protein
VKVNAATVKTLERLLGFDGGRIPADASAEFTWLNLPQSWGGFVLVGVVAVLVYAIFWMYSRELKTCPKAICLALGVLRCAAMVLLLVVYLQPAITYTQQKTRKPFVAVLRDESLSMGTADAYRDVAAATAAAKALSEPVNSIRNRQPTRTSIVDHLLRADDRAFLWNLQSIGEVRLIDFSDRVKQVQTRPALMRTGDASDEETDQHADDDPRNPPLPLLVADGLGTDLSRAIDEALKRQPVAAVVVFTDGQHTGNSNVEEAVRKAKEAGVRVYFVAVGDPSPARNLKVANVYVDQQVWREDPFTIEAVLSSQGIDEPHVDAELIERRIQPDGSLSTAETVVARQSVLLPVDGTQKRIAFQHQNDAPGRYVYTVRLPLVEDESNANDNSRDSTEIKVLDTQARVLLIAGAPSWEYQLVHRVLHRDKTINLSCWLQTMDPNRAQEGNTIINRLPDTEKAMFAYDVILLFDPDPRDFDEAWINLLKEFGSRHAGGVLYMAGPKFAGRFLDNASTRGIRDILPVTFGDVGAMEVASLLAANSRAWPLGVVERNLDHDIMSFFGTPRENRDRWKTLPGIYWSFPAAHAKTLARTLVDHTDPTLRTPDGPRPLMVTGYSGAGRVAYLGFNGTWRWRRVGPNAKFFRDFWIRTTRYLLEGRSFEGKRRGFVEVKREVYELGSRVDVKVQANDGNRPLALPELMAIHRGPEGQTPPIALKSIPGQAGWYQGSMVAKETGFHSINVQLPDGVALAPAKFQVEEPSGESGAIWRNDDLLEKTAAIAGGKVYQVDQLDQLLASVPTDLEQTFPVQGKPVTLWDNRVLLILVVVLLGIEWATRKWFRLL